jgi:hypothetical protein
MPPLGVAAVTHAVTGSVAARERAFVQWRTAGLLFAAAVLVMPAGLLVLVTASERLLTLLIEVVVVGIDDAAAGGRRILVSWVTPRHGCWGQFRLLLVSTRSGDAMNIFNPTTSAARGPLRGRLLRPDRDPDGGLPGRRDRH